MLLPAKNLWGTLRPLREKGAAGFGDLMTLCGKSRMEPHAVQRLSLFVPPVLAARWEARKGLPVSARFPGLPTHRVAAPVWKRVRRL